MYDELKEGQLLPSNGQVINDVMNVIELLII